MRKYATPLAVIASLVILCTTAWLHDFVTLHGGKTIYTADCTDGHWEGNRCEGTLTAGKRYRFKPLTTHSEVLFWIAGSREPSGKLTQCTIDNAKEWTCPKGADGHRAIAHGMKFGKPVWNADGGQPDVHPVPKWKWLLLQAGFPYLHTSDPP